MAYGGLFDKNDPGIAAHRTFPPGTILKLWNITEGKDGKIEIKEAQVTIRDRGPNIESRDLDISEAAAKRINLDGVKALLVWVAN
jgi:rare lipoprotein A (peptidoglycan hydrolase)